jgi:branched-chain amino acid transport system substrate-binding protein
MRLPVAGGKDATENDCQELPRRASLTLGPARERANAGRSRALREAAMFITTAIRRMLSRAMVVGLALCAAVSAAGAADPLRIGLSLSLTGPTAPAGKQVLAGLEIWRDDVNAKGGLLGRPVQLLYYDDQGNPANAPAIYAKLIGVDKVDLLIGPYSTNVIAAAMPAIIQHKRTTIGIFGLGANQKFKYPKYFSMNSQGPSPANYSKCVFDLAAAQKPKPVRVALVGAEVEYSRHALEGARQNAKAMGFDIVFDRTYPPSTTEFTPIVRAMQAAKPDVVFGATLPVDTAGIIQTAKELQFRPKMIGGAMLGLLVTAIKQKLGPDINGYISNEFYIPAPSLQFEGTARVLNEYQRRAKQLGIDPLGYTYPPYAYAAGQILAKAVSTTKSLDDDKLAAYMRDNSFDTVIGPIKFGANGEWTTPRIICIQFQGIDGHDLDQFKNWSRQVVVYPDKYKSGKLVYPLK